MKSHDATDRIEKEIVLRAPRSRALGQIALPDHGNVTIEIAIERMDPESRMSYRWHPYAMQSGVDYSSEPTTLVEFQLEEIAEGTRLTVVESGFDAIPASRRAEAFRMN